MSISLKNTVGCYLRKQELYYRFERRQGKETIRQCGYIARAVDVSIQLIFQLSLKSTSLFYLLWIKSLWEMAQGSYSGSIDGYMVDVQRRLRRWWLEQCQRGGETTGWYRRRWLTMPWLSDFDSNLQDMVHSDNLQQDTFNWICTANGAYSAKDSYRMLCQGRRSSVCIPLFGDRSPRSNAKFSAGWLSDTSLTSDRRQRHGLQESTEVCFTCLQEEDTVDHPYAMHILASGLVWVFDGGRSKHCGACLAPFKPGGTPQGS
jgi:hypothetical protein